MLAEVKLDYCVEKIFEFVSCTIDRSSPLSFGFTNFGLYPDSNLEIAGSPFIFISNVDFSL